MSTNSLAAQLGLVEVPGAISSAALERSWPALIALAERRLSNHGSFADWARTISELPIVAEPVRSLSEKAPRVSASAGGGANIEASLRKLGPWKKGPFDVLGTFIDAEWRSDKKWSRVQDIAAPLENKKVLDVGTGNGYFLLRAAGDGAHFVLGLEPSVHYSSQYLALQRLYACPNVALLPATSGEFVENCAAFDTVLSMGVLYHRRSPLDHLMELRSFIKSGGELVLETIVVDGDEGYSLVPGGRYAQMRNVWFLPSVPTLKAWLKRLGFKNIRSTEALPTTLDEQRSTDWTNQPSLADFLDPNDSGRTIEGYPAPQRSILVATAP